MIDKYRLQAATGHGATFLQSVQDWDGGFQSFSSPTLVPFRPVVPYHTTFTPSLILAALGQVQGPAALSVRRKLAAWLLTQKSTHWSFNYWALAAPERTTLPYPDDLDDTFCALIALYQHDPSLIDQTCLGKVVKLLIAAESQVGGPYRTWLTAADAPHIWQDIDLAVNCNIASFLGLVAEPLPNLTVLMEQAIASRDFRSPYYPSPYPLIYYLARAYQGPQTATLASYLIDHQQDGWWGNPLDTALAVSALTRLGRTHQCAPTVQRLLEQQLPDGSWAAQAFCLDPAIRGQKHYNGSAALTTALVLEALARYAPAATDAPPIRGRRDTAANTLHSRISTTALGELGKLSPDLRHHSQVMLERMKQGDTNHEIVLLPYLFTRSLVTAGKAASQHLIHLGLANLYGWTAYTIYDDFLDEEGTPALLPVANTALRYSLQHFRQALPKDSAFQQLVEHSFDAIDGANAWEVARCRFALSNKSVTISRLPDYGDRMRLAERSLGHTLTPLGVLAAAGVAPADPRAQAVQRALKHYLIARQLNDDLHDWEPDLRTGQATYVVTAILRDLCLRPGTYSLAGLLPKMQRQFWHHTLTNICGTITHHTALARQAVATSRLLTQPNIITTLVDAIDESVQRTLQEQAKAESFLAAYRSTNN